MNKDQLALLMRIGTLLTTMREYKLIDDALRAFDLDLNGLTVLTEAASGNYVWTSIIAARAGAQVIAYSRNSRHATFAEVKQRTLNAALQWNLNDKIHIVSELLPTTIAMADIITNTGFLRPLNKPKLQYAKSTAVIPLMWETWEYREADLDLSYCYQRQIPVLGTNESDPRLKTIEYLGAVTKKLLFECSIEVFQTRLAIVGNGRFAQVIQRSLEADNALCRNVTKFSVNDIDFINNSDAVIVADHESTNVCLPANLLCLIPTGMRLIHISGGIDVDSCRLRDISLYPHYIAPIGSMSVTTDYVGPRPIINLHTAGLKVGQEMARLRLKGFDFDTTLYLLAGNSLCQSFSTSQKSGYLTQQ